MKLQSLLGVKMKNVIVAGGCIPLAADGAIRLDDVGAWLVYLMPGIGALVGVDCASDRVELREIRGVPCEKCGRRRGGGSRCDGRWLRRREDLRGAGGDCGRK